MFILIGTIFIFQYIDCEKQNPADRDFECKANIARKQGGNTVTTGGNTGTTGGNTGTTGGNTGTTGGNTGTTGGSTFNYNPNHSTTTNPTTTPPNQLPAKLSELLKKCNVMAPLDSSNPDQTCELLKTKTTFFGNAEITL